MPQWSRSADPSTGCNSTERSSPGIPCTMQCVPSASRFPATRRTGTPMATLLHLDSSVLPVGMSVSRDVTDTFRKEWVAQHPDGKVIYRDFHAEPLPHVDFSGVSAAFTAP